MGSTTEQQSLLPEGSQPKEPLRVSERERRRKGGQGGHARALRRAASKSTPPTDAAAPSTVGIPDEVIHVPKGRSRLRFVLMILLIIAVYSSMGGIRGVIITDFIQFLLSFVGGAWLAFNAWHHVGGRSGTRRVGRST